MGILQIARSYQKVRRFLQYNQLKAGDF